MRRATHNQIEIDGIIEDAHDIMTGCHTKDCECHMSYRKLIPKLRAVDAQIRRYQDHIARVERETAELESKYQDRITLLKQGTAELERNYQNQIGYRRL